MKIIKVIDHGQFIINDYSDILFDEIDKLAKSDDKLADNYKMENLQLRKHLSFDAAFTNNNELIAFCGIFNGGRYPDGIYRILNRTYVSPKFRIKGLRGGFFCTKNILTHQLNQYKDLISTAFVSVEELKGKSYLTAWIANAPPFNNSKWILSDGFVQVSNAHNKGCYQYIAYNGTLWTDDIIDKEAWLALPEKYEINS